MYGLKMIDLIAQAEIDGDIVFRIVSAPAIYCTDDHRAFARRITSESLAQVIPEGTEIEFREEVYTMRIEGDPEGFDSE